MSLALAVLTIIAILFIKIQEEKLKDGSYQCNLIIAELGDQELTEALALQDEAKPEEDRLGYMYCLCYERFWGSISSGESYSDSMSTEFDDGERHCEDWLSKYSVQQIAAASVPVAILVVNSVAKAILEMMTKYEGYQSKPEEVFKTSINVALMAFINTGLLVQIVYFDWTGGAKLPLLMTEYSEFTSEWYQRVGSTIVYTMVLMVLTNPVSNLVMQLLRKLILCWDRGCSRDEKSTKKLVQEDYENVNLGNEFTME